ncbi:MAG: cytochrome C peroxidase [Bacteroidetes bacterium]|nr:cytochrome C peroxidase [Bacteroidota bacterium]
MLLVIFAACEEPDPPAFGEDLSSFPYNPQAYSIEVPQHFNPVPVPANNPMTTDGVALGRYLFYDPILSVDSTISCASCHKQAFAFSDNSALSIGVGDTEGIRNSMSLANVGFYDDGLFWDGRVGTLEEQSLHPIEDPLEMKDTWSNVEDKLRRHPDYQKRFRAAFGIENSNEITRDLVTKALAQFERTLISGTAKYDFSEFDWGQDQQFFSSAELRGRNLFFDEPSDPNAPHPGCSHCHTSVLLTTNEYSNNGLDEAPELTEFDDKGRGAVTGYLIDNGKFRVPTLRNVELTAPYMHDGRFETLEEVLDHYSSGGHYAPNLDANITAFPLTAEQKSDLLAFLKTMTDTDFVENPAFSSPF